MPVKHRQMLGIDSKSGDSPFIVRSKLLVVIKKKVIKGQIQQENPSCGDQDNLGTGGKRKIKWMLFLWHPEVILLFQGSWYANASFWIIAAVMYQMFSSISSCEQKYQCRQKNLCVNMTHKWFLRDVIYFSYFSRYIPFQIKRYLLKELSICWKNGCLVGYLWWLKPGLSFSDVLRSILSAKEEHFELV